MNDVILEKHGFCVGDIITLSDGLSGGYKNKLIIREIIHLKCDNKYHFVVEDFFEICNNSLEQKSICKMMKKRIAEAYEMKHSCDKGNVNNSQIFTTNR